MMWLFGLFFTVSVVFGHFSVDNVNGVIVDEYSRQSTFHGVNVVYKVPPYHPETISFNSNTSLNSDDAKMLKKWGFNVVRLYVAWPGVFPERNQLNTTYLQEIEKIVGILGEEGIFTILDMHQDVGSRFLCGEGIPDWLFRSLKIKKPFPHPLPFHIDFDSKGYPLISSCKKHGFSFYYFAEATSVLWEELYRKGSDLYEGLIEFWDKVSQYFSSNENVISYELINEPWAGNPELLLEFGKTDKEYLFPLYEDIISTIQKNDPNHLIFFEPMVADMSHVGFDSVPGNPSKSVLSYHVYCQDRDSKGDPKIRWVCDLLDDYFIDTRTQDWHRLKSTGFITEFGSSANDTKGIEAIDWMTGEFEKRFTSYIYWQYKLFHDYADSSGDLEGFFDLKTGEVELDKVKALSRTYAQRTCGIATFNLFDPKTSRWEYKFRIGCKDDKQPVLIVFMNEELYYSDGFEVSIQPSDILTWKVREENYLEFNKIKSIDDKETISIVISKKK